MTEILAAIVAVLVVGFVALAWTCGKSLDRAAARAVTAAERKSADELTVIRLLCGISEKIHADNSETMATLVDRATTISDQEINLKQAMLEIDRLREALDRKQATVQQQSPSQPDDMFG